MSVKTSDTEIEMCGTCVICMDWLRFAQSGVAYVHELGSAIARSTSVVAAAASFGLMHLSGSVTGKVFPAHVRPLLQHFSITLAALQTGWDTAAASLDREGSKLRYLLTG